jgi:hypothetical protein
MDNNERIGRCNSVKCRYVDVPDIPLVLGGVPYSSHRQCLVYSRWVEDCDDCSFDLKVVI